MTNYVEPYEDETKFLESMAKLLKENNMQDSHVRTTLADFLIELAKHNETEVKSRLCVLMTHMLKLKYQPGRATQSWIDTIYTQSRNISFAIEDSPLIKHKLTQEILNKIYQKSVTDAVRETHLPKDTFPKECPWLIKQMLDDDYITQYVIEHEELITNYYFKSNQKHKES